MNSLRSRLILGSALIAVIPLAVTIYLLSQRIEEMVRAQAADRLSAVLGGLETQVQSDRQRISGKLVLLARDPLLKRLYLVRPTGSRELSEYLTERRFLLGLDFLQVSDTSGAVVADGSTRDPNLAVDFGRPSRGEMTGARGASGLLTLDLDQMAGLAMATSVPIRYENEPAGLLRGGLFFDASFLMRLKKTSGVDLVLRAADGRLVATTLPGRGVVPVPVRGEVERTERAGRSYMSRSFALEPGAPPQATITGMVSTAAADQTIAALQLSSALLGLLGLALAILLGILWSSQISRPVERLAAFSHKLAQGDWDEPLILHSVEELETLVAALDRMRRDLRSYRDKLVTSERQAAWSQMARKVAHEIKNPLTPIAVSVADLKRSYEQQRADFPEILDQAVRTIADEVETLKRLLQEFADFARFPTPRLVPCRLSALLADLATLYGRDLAEGRLVFSPPPHEITFPADPGQIRQALVNLIKNGLEAVDGGGRVTLAAAVSVATLEIAVADDGPGLDAEQRAHLFVPGFTTKRSGSGLGLTIVERIVNDHRGTITVDPGPGRGTTFRIHLPLGTPLGSPPSATGPART